MSHNQAADPLESLLNEALAEGSRKRVLASPNKPERAEKRLRADKRFANPDRWKPTKVVALMHLESMILLGNFQEFMHDSLAARKLCRLEGPAVCDELEWVKGDQWLTPKQDERLVAERWSESREVVCGITLATVGLHCPAASVCVRLEFGGMACVVLLDATRFTCPSRNTFMLLPKGLDVIEAMSFDSKLALRSELGMDEAQKEPE